MVSPLMGYPYAEARFDKAARLVEDDREGAGRLLGADQVTDVLVLAHGWNNDMDEARDLYRRIATSVRQLQDGPDRDLVGDRRLALLGVLWPSKRFAESELIPGGAASFGLDGEAQLAQRIDTLRDAFDAEDAPTKLEEAKSLASSLEDSRAARTRFVELLREIVPSDAGEEEDASQLFLEIDADDLLRQLDDPTLDDATLLAPTLSSPGSGGAAVLDDVTPAATGGAGAGLGLGGMVRSAQRLLNFVTYYQMKARAGLVGERGLAPLLRSDTGSTPRLHLVGHSFGGRLVTAAAAAETGAARLGSLVLLQAAFSHYGFAQNWKPGTDGAFRPVLTRGTLNGPLVITHTRNDRAVGIAYALASRIANQVGAELGGASSLFGGIGANGAQQTPDAVRLRLLPVPEQYAFTPGRVHNLESDAFIADHGAVSGSEVAHAILSAVRAS